MRLESALYSSREGLTAQGQAISVVGDNIANSNTVGFKRSRVEFADIMAGGAEGGSGSTVGEAGNGVKVNRVRQIHETGVIEQTGRPLDVGIGGDGFFIVKNDSGTYYTRAGNFSVDKNGLLADHDGNNVLGYTPASPTSLTTLDMVNISTAGSPTSKMSLTGNLNANDPVGTVSATPASFDAIDDAGTAASFVKYISAYDSLGKVHAYAVAFTKNDVASRTWTAQAFIDGGDVGGTAGTPVLAGTLNNLTFSTSGAIDPASQANMNLTVNAAYSNGAAPGSFTVNLGGFTQFAGESIVTSITNDGQAVGNIKSYEIEKDGDIFAVLDTGNRTKLGTIQLADFANRDALERAGNSTFSASASTGDAKIAAPGQTGLGELEGGSLERSTVDIADQFVELVIFQRAYQASSQTLNAANSLIRDTLGLIR